MAALLQPKVFSPYVNAREGARFHVHARKCVLSPLPYRPIKIHRPRPPEPRMLLLYFTCNSGTYPRIYKYVYIIRSRILINGYSSRSREECMYTHASNYRESIVVSPRISWCEFTCGSCFYDLWYEYNNMHAVWFYDEMFIMGLWTLKRFGAIVPYYIKVCI